MTRLTDMKLVNIGVTSTGKYYSMLSIMCGVCCDGGWWNGGYNGLAVKMLLSLYLENSCHVNNLWEIAPNKNLSSRNKCSLSSVAAINAISITTRRNNNWCLSQFPFSIYKINVC